MSLWSGFVSTLKGAGKGVAEFAGGLVSPILGAGAAFGAGQVARTKPEVAAAAGLASQQAIDNSLKKAGLGNPQKSMAKVVDPVLEIANKAEQYVFSPIIARPISTAYLLTDPNSPLYNTEKYREGFQISDVLDAYERTGDKYKIVNGEKVLVSRGVSLGVSMLKSKINPFASLQSGILELGGIDVDNIDLWNDADVKKNFQDNVFGKYVTGINDFIFKNSAINAAGSLSSAAVKAAQIRAGLNTRFRVGDVNAMPQWEKLADDHIQFRESGGTQGSLSVIGQDIEDLAKSDNIIQITEIAKRHSLNPRLPDLIRDTKDPRMVRDFLLADKAYGPAIERLTAARMADDMWYAADGTTQVQMDFLQTGKVRTYTAEQRARWMQAFDDAIAKNPKSQELYDAFLKEEINPQTGVVTVEPRMFGRDYKPAEPIIGKELYAKSRSRAMQLKTARLERDFSNIGGVTQTVLGGRVGGPATVLMRTFGTYMPKGLVTNSGLRPLDGVNELLAVFDDVPLFTKGNSNIVIDDLSAMTVSEYRRKVIDEFVSAKTDAARGELIDNLNTRLARTIAYSRGFYNNEIIDRFVDELMSNVRAVHGDLRQFGHSMDPTGVRVSIDIKTQRQLQNAMPMLPFGELDRMILRAARREKSIIRGTAQNIAGGTKDATRSVFELGNKAFSLAQLYRFSYIPKNSVIEPMLSAVLAKGSELTQAMATTASKTMIQNGVNFIMRNVEKSKTIFPSAKKEIQRELNALSEQYNQAIIIRDQVYAQFEQFFKDVPGVSPRTKADWADIVKADLRAAEKVVDNIEANFNRYTVEYGKPIEVPSVYNLRRRVETLKNSISKEELEAYKVREVSGIKTYKGLEKRVESFAKADVSLIAKAEGLIQEASNKINMLAPELVEIEARIASTYDEIGNVLNRISPKLRERADLFSVADARYAKKPLMPDTVKRTLSNGQVVEFPSFTNENYLGNGYMSEIVNTNTRTLEVLGNKATVAKINTIFRNSPANITNVTDPLYFGELTYVVNNFMRGDVLIDQILAGASRPQLLEWALSNRGASYARNMGLSPEDAVKIVDEAISYVNRYLPTAEAQRLAAAGVVKETDLQRALADKLDQMVPIQPLEVPYGKPTTFARQAGAAFDSLTSTAFRQLGKPENLIREVWGTLEHASRTVAKAEMLIAQGQEVSLSTLLAIRQAAAAELVEDVSKVFYTIPRQQRALYLARTAMTFPNAMFSGIYRYTGFAVKQPTRVAGFLNSYYSLYNSYGVDKYGNPVEDPMKAEYLLIPGTKEMGFNKGKGIILSARATNFIANLPGPSWLVPVLISQFTGDKPDTNEELKKLVDKTIGKIPNYSYDDLFPFGVEVDIKKQLQKTFVPAWARNLNTALSKDMTDKMWVDSLISESNRQWTLYEMKVGPKPTEESVMKGTRSIYLRKFRTQFFSLLGSAQYVETRPDSLFTDYYNMLVNKYKAKGNSDTKSYELAQKEFSSRMDLPGAVFPIDRLFVSSQEKRAYITPSAKAYSRIWDEFSGLAKELETINPILVGLLTADLPKDYSPQVNKFLNDPNATLPGGTVLNSQLKTPEMVEDELTKSRFWKSYSEYKDTLNKAAKEAGYASYRSVPELVDALRDYAVNSLGAASEVWFAEYKQNITKGDQAWANAYGLSKIIKNKEFVNKFGNTQFWVHAKAFVDYRNSYVRAYQDAPSGYKNQVKEAWLKYLEESLELWDPVMQNIINRYFQNDSLEETK